MILGRPVRIILACAAMATVSVVTLVAVIGPSIASVIECGPPCSLDLDSIPSVLRFATPFVSIVLAAGLLVWPAVLVRPAAVGSGVLAIGWIGPVAQGLEPAADMQVALSLLSASPFLLVTPVGHDVGRWARWSWIATIVVALLLWLLDEWGSRFMQSVPVPPQLAFLGVAAAVLGAGLLSGVLRRLEGEGRAADGMNTLPGPPGT